MRLWSIHPEYLDAKGLVALWREGLLAQNVLLGKTKGYKNHPQLQRFRQTNNPLGAIASYLRTVVVEAEKRNYNFDKSKIVNKRLLSKIDVTDKQVTYEFKHLLVKLKHREPSLYKNLVATNRIKVNTMFNKTRGKIAEWEVVK